MVGALKIMRGFWRKHCANLGIMAGLILLLGVASHCGKIGKLTPPPDYQPPKQTEDSRLLKPISPILYESLPS